VLISLQICLKYISLKEESIKVLLYMYTGVHVKCPIFVSRFNITLIFSMDCQEILKYRIS